MIKCDPQSLCPVRNQQYCGECAGDCCFTEGSECDKFNRAVLSQPMTNADRIRAMSDEELAELFADDERACPPEHPHCPKYVNKCDGCWLEWLRQPVKEDP